MEGTVKWFNKEKHFGFITGEDGKEYFLHHSAMAPDSNPRENQRVSFDPAKTERGEQAHNVKLK